MFYIIKLFNNFSVSLWWNKCLKIKKLARDDSDCIIIVTAKLVLVLFDDEKTHFYNFIN